MRLVRSRFPRRSAASLPPRAHRRGRRANKLRTHSPRVRVFQLSAHQQMSLVRTPWLIGVTTLSLDEHAEGISLDPGRLGKSVLALEATIIVSAQLLEGAPLAARAGL